MNILGLSKRVSIIKVPKFSRLESDLVQYMDCTSVHIFKHFQVSILTGFIVLNQKPLNLSKSDRFCTVVGYKLSKVHYTTTWRSTDIVTV